MVGYANASSPQDERIVYVRLAMRAQLFLRILKSVWMLSWTF